MEVYFDPESNSNSMRTQFFHYVFNLVIISCFVRQEVMFYVLISNIKRRSKNMNEIFKSC